MRWNKFIYSFGLHDSQLLTIVIVWLVVLTILTLVSLHNRKRLVRKYREPLSKDE